MFIVDFISGFIFEEIKIRAKGLSHDDYHVVEQPNEDILILGSSRAYRHYDPRVLEDSIGLTTFNGGISGCGIVLQYGRYIMSAEKYLPKIIIYDIFPMKDLVKNDNLQYISGLRHYRKSHISWQICSEVESNEKLKMLSNLYCYNTDFIHLAKECVSPTESSFQGYAPYKGKMNYHPKSSYKKKQIVIDSLKLGYLEQLIQSAQKNDIFLVFCSSPHYLWPDIDSFVTLDSLCNVYNVPFLNYYDSKEFAEHLDYWHDSTHLNEKGADIYTKLIASEIKKLYYSKKKTGC